jgi:hypothetical protein
MRAFDWSSLLQDVATTLSDQNQFVAHCGSGSVGYCPVQLPARAIDLPVALDDLAEAGHREHPFDHLLLRFEDASATLAGREIFRFLVEHRPHALANLR